MGTVIAWMGQDHRWGYVILHFIGSAMVLGFDVWDGPEVTNKRERNLHFMAILLWEITFVCAVLWFVGQIIKIGFEETKDFLRKMKKNYSLQ